MHVHVEPLSAIVRVFENGKSYGDPYEWAGAIRCLDRNTVEVVGTMQAPSVKVWRELKKCLPDFGITTVIFKRRMRDGTMRTKQIQGK